MFNFYFNARNLSLQIFIKINFIFLEKLHIFLNKTLAFLKRTYANMHAGAKNDKYLKEILHANKRIIE